MKTSPCKGCGNPVVWAVNPATGKTVPLDPSGIIYKVVEKDDGTVEALQCDKGEGYMVSHFNTCPDANSFSKGGSKRESLSN